MRGPHRYGMGRAIDGDAGGVAELQTDVMRFMAILALCLVVIFALVQSIPRPVEATAPEPTRVQTAVAPEPVVDSTPVAEMPPAPQPIETPPSEPERIVLTRPEPARAVPVEAAKPDPLPEPAVARPAPAPAPPAPAEAAQEGFTLQFESDIALTRLVGRNAVGLYALNDDTALRMSVNRGRVSFWPASLPAAFHEMDPSTVPADVSAALQRTYGAAAPVTWGVTLPANLQRQLDAILRDNDGGALFIAGDGNIRLVR